VARAPGAVLEVHPTPGFSSDGRAEFILRQSFPDGADGRIPSVILVGADRRLIDRVDLGRAAGRCVGTTDAAITVMAGQPALPGRRSLPDR
jgi:hypothetical protein